MECEECAFAAARTAGRQFRVRRVRGEAPERIFGLTPHDALREVCLCNYNRPESLEHVDEHRVLCCGLKGASDVAESGVVADDVELVLEGHGDAVERAYRIAGVGELFVEVGCLLNGVDEHDFC